MNAAMQSMVSDLLIAPVAKTNSATASASLDTVTSRGKASWVQIKILYASEVNTNAVGPTVSLLESDDTVVTNHATITANRSNVDLTAARCDVYNVDMRGRKRYLRLTVTTDTTTNDNITVAASYDLFVGEHPASTSDVGADAVVNV